jgi:molybdopterin synthase sulfur carrier subunit
MSVQIEFLGPLRRLVDGKETILIEPATIAEALAELDRKHSGINQRLLQADGTLHRHINIFVNEEDIRFGDQLQTVLSSGDKVTVISAIAGG